MPDPRDPIILGGGRYQILRYDDHSPKPEDQDDFEHNHRTVVIKDIRTGEEIYLHDRGRDGLDSVSHDSRVEDFVGIYEEAVRRMEVMIPSCFKRFQDYLHSKQVEMSDVLADGDADNVWFHISYATPFGGEQIFTLKGLADGTQITGANGVFTSIDPATGVEICVSNQPSQEEFMRTSLGYLQPLLGFKEQIKRGDTNPVFSGRWIPFLHSRELDQLDGEVIEGGGPSQRDYELAADTFRASQPPRHLDLYRDAALSIVDRYQRVAGSENYSDFLRQEMSAAESLGQKMKSALGIARDGRDWFLEGQILRSSGNLTGLARENSIWNRSEGDYFIRALDQLLKLRSTEGHHLGEGTLAYIDKHLVRRGSSLFFSDPGQAGGKQLEINPSDLLLILEGSLPIFPVGINIDGFYLSDENGDGRFDYIHDIAWAKGGGVGHNRRLSRVNPMDVFSALKEVAPPPFDTSQLFQDGVPFEDLRKWADAVGSTSVIRQDLSEEPMSDGVYRAFIYRVPDDQLDNNHFWVSAFAWLNGFDDVFIVPQTWGLEVALNTIASRGLPVDHLYIGSHSDSELGSGNLLLDYDRHLIFAKGGRVTYTPCQTWHESALAIGAYLFRESSGSVMWGDGLNVPWPFGGMSSFNDGRVYISEFENGREVVTRLRDQTEPVVPYDQYIQHIDSRLRGRLEYRIIKDSNGNVIRDELWNVYGIEQIVMRRIHHGWDKYTTRIFRYDEDHHLTTELFYGSDDKIFRRIEYDRDGYEIKSKSYFDAEGRMYRKVPGSELREAADDW